jgi:deoxyribodipyrimidine photo-lyase
MQAAQRGEWNHALEYAAGQANDLRKPLVVFFGLTDQFPEATERHYAFLLEGLKETWAALRDRGILTAVRRGSPAEEIVRFARRACLVVTDDGYLRVEKAWRAEASAALECPLVEITTNAIVPVETVSTKEEYAAATLRPKIYRHLGRFLVPLIETEVRRDSLRFSLESLDISDTGKVLAGLAVDRRAGRVSSFLDGTRTGGLASFRGGTSEARKRLRTFIETKLAGYAEARNDPSLEATSWLSPYLHFGQISPLFVALEVKKGPRYGQAPFLEQLIVRRELALNFVQYNPKYDTFAGLPAWCRETLLERTKDRREYTYAISDFEQARTHDPYWNAAQMEMVLTGWMHGYMRMYWGKKILEWSPSPATAYRTALALNNRYELDGRDPNGFAGIAWCFGKHDRPWAPRPVFGTIRYMNAAGLRRKFDVETYVQKIEALAGPGSGPLSRVRGRKIDNPPDLD